MTGKSWQLLPLDFRHFITGARIHAPAEQPPALRRGAYPRARTDRQQSPAEKNRKRSFSAVGTSIACPAFGTNAICRRQITIRDLVIQTGSIALAGDLFRFAEPGAWIRAPTYADANDDTGLRHSHGQHRPCGRFVPLRGTGRVDTRPYAEALRKYFSEKP